MVDRTSYDSPHVLAARSVLLELVRLLGEYKDDMVLVGGWVPMFLLPASVEGHIGSIDIDIALNHCSVEDECYRTIKALLMVRGYEEAEQPYVFYRTISIDGSEIVVEVDFLAGEYSGSGKAHRTQSVQDIRARKARGCDLAFDMNVSIQIEGNLPSGALDSAQMRVASIVPFIVMKGMAMAERLKEKDAYDIYYCLNNYPGGLDALIREFTPHIGNGLVQEGLRKIADKFASVDHYGPGSVADFYTITDPEERDRVKRDAFERVDYLLRGLKLT